MTTQPDMVSILEDQGYRSTLPRRRVIDLLKTKNLGFTVEEISDELPTVGRATVFRTFKILLEAGALCKLSMPDCVPKYSLSFVEHHHHTVCVSCGSVGEFRASTVERLIRSVEDDIVGKVVGHRIEIYINCGRCLGGKGDGI